MTDHTVSSFWSFHKENQGTKAPFSFGGEKNGVITVRDGARIKYKLMGFMVYFNLQK
jgi:hypothetical protein